MRKTDYYSYWNKARVKKEKLLDRESASLKIIRKIARAGDKMLDVGCGNGDFMLLMKKHFPKAKIEGIDISKREVKEAQKRKLKVKLADIEKGAKLKANYYDIAYAGEVIEHLYNPDFFLEQMNSCLKKNGYLFITTPNLLAWYNRILALIGIQPLFLEPSTKSKLVGAGFLKRFKNESTPVGHVRIFTFSALEDLLKMHGFKIIEARGAIFDEGLPKKIWLIDRFFNAFPKLASHFVILAEKK
jgi:ubiquinone/menaquinone biosynthesis C-methylase UbiE